MLIFRPIKIIKLVCFSELTTRACCVVLLGVGNWLRRLRLYIVNNQVFLYDDYMASRHKAPCDNLAIN